MVSGAEGAVIARVVPDESLHNERLCIITREKKKYAADPDRA